MRISAQLNIADVDAAIREYVAKHAPSYELVGYTVKSWSQTVFEVHDNTLVEPFHRINKDHRELK